ncbi:MAG: methylamine utilization protein MauJ [Phenylobacterium sp.]
MAYGMIGRRTTNLSAHPFELDYLPDPADPKARLALALCREAAALNQATYAVISYFRVFETHFQGTSRDIKNWLNANIGSVADGRAKDVLARLTAAEPDIGHYLYDACRSAAAHGKIGTQRIIDPDDPEDERRLARDLPLIQAMAVKLTEEILGIQTTSTVYKEHLYELAGFKPLFTREALDAFAADEPCPPDLTVDLPVLNIGLFDKPAFTGLNGLQPVHLEAITGGVKAVFRREDGLVEFHVGLDFKNERLEFEIGRDLLVFDDKTAEAMEVAASVVEFQKGYFLNGRLRLDDAETGQLLARKDAFLPVNVIVNPEGFDAQIARCLKEAAARRDLSQKLWRARLSPAQVSYSIDLATAADTPDADTTPEA